MRILFIHGLGETEAIFKNIAPAIGNEQVFINLWNLLGTENQEGLNVLDFSKKVAEKYNITASDWVIGHSLGGWIAYHIKHHTNCHVIQIASWTEFSKIISPIRAGSVIYWLIRHGLYLNNFQKWLFAQAYNGLPSKEIFVDSFARLVNSNREAAINQLKLIFEPVPPISVSPDLRIHALRDKLVKPPTQPFVVVPGDHFSLYTYPAEVIQPIIKLLQDEAVKL